MARSRVKWSFVLPCYNEEANMPYVEQELLPALSRLDVEFEVVFVDDGCSDRTALLIEEMGERHESIRLVRHERNRGLGAAIRTGIAAVEGDLVVTLDTDLTFHPRQIADLKRRFDDGDVDCVIGSPTLRGYDESIPYYRIFLSKGVNRLYNIALGANLTGVSPIFRLYRASQLRSLELTSDGFEINAEILAKLLLTGARVAEVPATLTTRLHGESKMSNLREIRNHLRLLAKIAYWRLRGRGATGSNSN